MKRIRWRRDFIIPLTFLVTVGVLGLLLLQLDRLYYQAEKFEIIREQREKLIPFNRKNFQYLIKQVVMLPPGSKEWRSALDKLEAAANDLLNSDGPIYRFIVYNAADPSTPLLDIKREKFRSHNTWKNSLFLRDFSRSSDLLVTEDDRGHERQIGRYILQHTTPLNSPEIEALTIHWRWRCFFITVAIFAVYGAILKGILLPMRRVISCLEREDLPAPVIMLRPGSLLERAYNNLARDACVTKLAAGLRDRIARDPSMDPVQLLEQIPQDLLVYFRFRDVSILSFRADEGGSLWIAEGVHGLGGTQKPGQNHASLAEALRRQIAARPPKDNLDEWKNFLGEYRTDRGENAWFFASWVDHRGGPETLFLLVLTARNTEFSSLTAWHRETCRLAADQVRLALEHLSSQKRVILQEKSKANISLSRNLGHDLTNIIATGKLDLLSVRKFLSLKIDDLKRSPQKEEIFRSSLNALLNNNRFLQETVNLYRSFSYLSRPKFESVDLRKLAGEVVELFRLSISSRIAVETLPGADTPDCVIEPRLVKLALFNLLTNSADAIKRKTAAENDGTGRIEVAIYEEKEAGEVCISIADSGTGILNKDGGPASQAEMDRIFKLGYTTKEHDEGEGLGLNWVHTIISDFHGGRIMPRNRAEGGAELTIHLRRALPASAMLTPPPAASGASGSSAASAVSSGPGALGAQVSASPSGSAISQPESSPYFKSPGLMPDSPPAPKAPGGTS